MSNVSLWSLHPAPKKENQDIGPQKRGRFVNFHPPQFPDPGDSKASMAGGSLLQQLQEVKNCCETPSNRRTVALPVPEPGLGGREAFKDRSC